jgi:hypothetical protein
MKGRSMTSLSPYHLTLIQLLEYLTGTCDEKTADCIRRHVFDCDHCTELLAAIRRSPGSNRPSSLGTTRTEPLAPSVNGGRSH